MVSSVGTGVAVGKLVAVGDGSGVAFGKRVAVACSGGVVGTGLSGLHPPLDNPAATIAIVTISFFSVYTRVYEFLYAFKMMFVMPKVVNRSIRHCAH